MPAWALSRCATIRAINENLRRADADFFLSKNCSILKNLQYYEKYFCQTPRIKSSCYWNYWKFAIGHTAFVEFCSKENAPRNEASSVHASKCFRRMKTVGVPWLAVAVLLTLPSVVTCMLLVFWEQQTLHTSGKFWISLAVVVSEQRMG